MKTINKVKEFRAQMENLKQMRRELEQEQMKNQVRSA